MLLFIIDSSNLSLLCSWGFSWWLNSPMIMISGHRVSIDSIYFGIYLKWLVCLYTNDHYSRVAIAPDMTITWWLPGGFPSEILIIFILRNTHLLPPPPNHHHHHYLSKTSFIFLPSVALDTVFLVGCGLSVSLSSF